MFIRARARISDIINGPGSSGGYRTVWHTLELEGLRVPRIVVQEMLRELDPEGCKLRRARRLKRREYVNPGPNFAWHMDGYDKLKPWGFPIHGCIDGFSRRILWLKVCKSNNFPSIPASYYLEVVTKLGGCPAELVSDRGTENSLAATMQSFFRENPESHRYVPSPRNQRIEGWWSFFSKNRTVWWRNLLKDMESKGEIDLSSELSKACLWYSFSGLLQQECDFVKEHWNTHYIRRSRHETVSGRPDSLFFLPEMHNAENLIKPVQSADIEYAKNHLLTPDVCEYTEYVEYIAHEVSAPKPATWQDACTINRELMSKVNEINS